MELMKKFDGVKELTAFLVLFLLPC